MLLVLQYRINIKVTIDLLQSMTQGHYLPEQLQFQVWTLQQDLTRLPSKTPSTQPHRGVQMKTTYIAKVVLRKKTPPVKPVIKKAVKEVIVIVKKRTAPGPGSPCARRLFLGTRRAV